MDLSTDTFVMGIVGVIAAAAMSTYWKHREKQRSETRFTPNSVEMKYDDGTEMRLGDRVRIKDGESGLIVAVVGARQFGLGYPKEEWSNVASGILVRMESGALVNFCTAEHRSLIGRSNANDGLLAPVVAKNNVARRAFAHDSKLTLPAA